MDAEVKTDTIYSFRSGPGVGQHPSANRGIAGVNFATGASQEVGSNRQRAQNKTRHLFHLPFLHFARAVSLSLSLSLRVSACFFFLWSDVLILRTASIYWFVVDGKAIGGFGFAVF